MAFDAGLQQFQQAQAQQQQLTSVMNQTRQSQNSSQQETMTTMNNIQQENRRGMSDRFNLQQKTSDKIKDQAAKTWLNRVETRRKVDDQLSKFISS